MTSSPQVAVSSSHVEHCERVRVGRAYGYVSGRCESSLPSSLTAWCPACLKGYLEALADGHDWMGGLHNGKPRAGFVDAGSLKIIADFLGFKHDCRDTEPEYSGQGWDLPEGPEPDPKTVAEWAAGRHGNDHDAQLDPFDIAIWSMPDSDYQAAEYEFWLDSLERDRHEDEEVRAVGAIARRNGGL